MRTFLHVAVLLALSLIVSHASAAPHDAGQLFAQHCASCHGADRLGAMGPALLPENLSRLKPAAARRVIASGRVATQMPAFEQSLSPDEIEALTTWIYRPAATPPPPA